MSVTPIPMPPAVYPAVGTVLYREGKLHWLWRAEHKSLVCDLATGAWTPATSEPFAHRRKYGVCVHANDDIILWGGAEKRFSHRGPFAPKGDGARLGAEGVWRPIASKGAPASRTTNIFAWSGKELVVWGGRGKSMYGNGGAYDPATDTWRKLSMTGAPSPRSGCESVWTGKELLLWGGHDFSPGMSSGGFREEGFAYDPSSDTWRGLAPLPASADGLGSQRDTIWLGDTALFIRRDYVSGSDIDTHSVWRYDVDADAFTPVCAPPEIRGGFDPKLVEVEGRALLMLGTTLLEYVLERDVWMKHEDVPSGYDTKLLYTGSEIIGVDVRGNSAFRFVLPKEAPLALEPRASRAGKPEATTPALETASDEDFVSEDVLRIKLRDLARGPVATAVALDETRLAVGHIDGAVMLWRFDTGSASVVAESPETARPADGSRVHGVALDRERVLCLTREALETRAHGELECALGLPEPGHTLAYRDGTCVVASQTMLIVISTEAKTPEVIASEVVAKRGWAIRTLSFAEDGAHVVVTLVQRSAPKSNRAHDAVEVRRVSDLALVAHLDAKLVGPGTSSVVLVATAVPSNPAKKKALAGELLVSGGGHYDIGRVPVGKKRKTGVIRTASAWNAPIALAARGRRVLSANASAGVQLFDVASGRAELAFELFSHEDWKALDALHPPPAFLDANEQAIFEERTRCGGPITAVAVDSAGARGAIATTTGAVFAFRSDTGAIDALTQGLRETWQPGVSAQLMHEKIIAGDAHVELGRAELVLEDGTYVEIDVDTGAITRGTQLDPAAILALRDHAYQSVAVRRHGDFLVIGSIRAEVFDARTGARVPEEARPMHPEGKGLWTVRKEGETYVLEKRDAITLRPVKTVPLPGEPASGTFCWLGGERWLVHLSLTPGAFLAGLSGTRFVVDAETGVLTPIDAANGCPTMDGKHFALPLGNGNAWRRWQIYGDDLATPLRTVASGQRFTHVGMLADGVRIVGYIGGQLAYWGRDGRLRGPFQIHGTSITEVCPSRSGDHVITWDRGGTVRRWRLE